MTELGPFSSSTAFCARCGSILPLLQEFGSVKCYACKAIYDAESKPLYCTFVACIGQLEMSILKNYINMSYLRVVFDSMSYFISDFSNLKFQYTINFNAVSVVTHENLLNRDDPEGPVVERKCPKCGNDRMSYATLQLRSADEGQTVFYTCISCK